MMGCDEVVEWLIDGARPASDTREVVAELCGLLVDCGIPLWRFGLFVLTLHPQIMGQAFLWNPGAGVAVSSASFETFETEAFRQSPYGGLSIALLRSAASSEKQTVRMILK